MAVSTITYADIRKLVTQSLASEQTKLDSLNTKRASYTSAQDDWRTIKTSLLSLKTSLFTLTQPSVFYSRTTASSDNDIVTAISSSSASITSYKLSDITLARAAAVSSGSALGLSRGSKTSITSDAVLNSASSIINSPGEWAGESAATPVMGGTYSGIDNDLWTFTANGSGTVGQADPLTITVKDQSNQTIATLDIGSNYDGSALTIVDGVTVAFSVLGSVVEGDSFSAGLVTGNADPNNAFNGTGLDSSNLSGTIVDGIFKINGVTIIVKADDTINKVLTKINSSAAGVTASYDNTTDSITFQNKSYGGGTIKLESDTSRFLEAVNLKTATPSVGLDADLNRKMSDVSALNGIARGEFTINNITFDVDPATETLQDIINKINVSAAGVSAFYDESIDKVILTSKETGKEITMGNDTGNFLNKIGLLDQAGDTDEVAGQSAYSFTKAQVTINDTALTFDGNTFTLNGTTFTLHSNTSGSTIASIEVSQDTAAAETAIKNFINKFNELSDLLDVKSGDGKPLKNERLIGDMRRQLRTIFTGRIDNSGSYNYLRDIGIVFDNGKLTLDSSVLSEAFTVDSDSVAKLFAFDSDNDGSKDDGGIANIAINDFISVVTRASTGNISRRVKFLDTKISRLADNIGRQESRMAKKEESLWKEYMRVMEAQAQINKQMTWFNSQVLSWSTNLQNLQ